MSRNVRILVSPTIFKCSCTDSVTFFSEHSGVERLNMDFVPRVPLEVVKCIHRGAGALKSLDSEAGQAGVTASLSVGGYHRTVLDVKAFDKAALVLANLPCKFYGC